MGSGDWFKTIISKRKTKHDQPKKVNAGSKLKSQINKSSYKLFNGFYSKKYLRSSGPGFEEIAATQIQSAFRCYQARKILRQLKIARRLHLLSDSRSIGRQTSNTLYYIHRWSNIQTEIRGRRASMVAENRIKLKKHENQIKLDTKLHDIEVEWRGGAETMEEAISKVYQREEAAAKRERAMAYAFSHQWRANPSAVHLGHAYEFAKSGNWGWSWKERWIAARPWEMRISTRKIQSKTAAKSFKKENSSPKSPASNRRIAPMKKSAPLEDQKSGNDKQNPAFSTVQIDEIAEKGNPQCALTVDNL